MDKKTRILIDTDIGGDVDDALALALALNTPSLEVTGITNVYLANAWRAGVTKHFLEVYGRTDIPVCTGAEKPLIGWWDENRIPDSSPDYGEERGGKLPHASDFIIEKCMADPELVIVAIGPLTNLGLAFAKAPHIARGRRVVMMGGDPSQSIREWNILCDPEAAEIVLESGANIEMVGCDMTRRCQFTEAEVDEVAKAGNPRTDMLGQMMRQFTKNFGYLPILHDPLALSVLVWDDILTFETQRIHIERAGSFTRGLTIPVGGSDGAEIRVATEVRVAEFKRRMIEVLKQ
ncbi:MAG: nucleoside hydrolase [Lachnospiraceae bacterium]|nr:nucleoside hydrolase [Lachnospiraceae bacterium]